MTSYEWARLAAGLQIAGWVLAVVGTSMLAWAVFRRWRRERKGGRCRCPKCWYDLSGHAGAGGVAGLFAAAAFPMTCPECGGVVAEAGELRQRRRCWHAVVGVLLLPVAYGLHLAPEIHEKGWRGVVPTVVLVALVDPGEWWVDRWGEEGSLAAELQWRLKESTKPTLGRWLWRRRVEAAWRASGRYGAEAEAKVIDRLRDSWVADLDGLSAGEVARWIEANSGVPIRLTFPPPSPYSSERYASASCYSALTAVELLTASLEHWCRWTVDADGGVTIESRVKACGQPSHFMSYDLERVLGSRGPDVVHRGRMTCCTGEYVDEVWMEDPWGDGGYLPDLVIQLLSSNVDAEDWLDNGGDDVKCEVIGTYLLVEAPAATIVRMSRLLDELEAAVAGRGPGLEQTAMASEDWRFASCKLEAPLYREPRVYRVKDLLALLPEPPWEDQEYEAEEFGPEERQEVLRKFLTMTIDPEGWQDNGGERSSLSGFRGEAIVVSTTPRIHGVIAATLEGSGGEGWVGTVVGVYGRR